MVKYSPSILLNSLGLIGGGFTMKTIEHLNCSVRDVDLDARRNIPNGLANECYFASLKLIRDGCFFHQYQISKQSDILEEPTRVQLNVDEVLYKLLFI